MERGCQWGRPESPMFMTDSYRSPGAEFKKDLRDTGLWGWLWQPERARRLKAKRLRERAQGDKLEQARLLALAADRLSEAHASREAQAPIIRYLLSQAIQSALAGLVTSPTAPAESDDQSATRDQRRALLTEILSSTEAAEELLVTLDESSLASEWGRGSRKEHLRTLKRVTRSLLERSSSTTKETEALVRARFIRFILPITSLVLLGVYLGPLRVYLREQQQISYPFRASSFFEAEPACKSPSQTCEGVNSFFCTKKEQRPWIEFDLLRERQVSGVVVENRVNCSDCRERAVPLVIQVSLDHKEWREVARKDEPFERWDVSLAPTPAKWLRLRAEKKTFLHLRQVRIVTE
jgi:hypothetical protein